MDGPPTTADSKHNYPQRTWSRSSSSPPVSRRDSFTSAAAQPEAAPAPLPAHLDLLPILFPQQSSLYHAQLLQYNKLVAPGRGGGGGLQTSPLPPLLSAQNIQAAPRSRSSSKVSNKESRPRPGSQNCHGKSSPRNPTRGDNALITGTESQPKMPPKKTDLAHPLPPRPAKPSSPPTISANVPTHPSSVPSTPHQRARKLSFDRELSPTADNQSHSPRSAYSETNSTLPSLRPLPPRSGGCKYETALQRSRRRIPYSIGSEPLDSVDPSKIRSRLSEDDERRLTTDMRELYDRLQPTYGVEEKRRKLVQKLERLLNTAWPGHDIRVYLFGSSGNLLCSDDSDGWSQPWEVVVTFANSDQWTSASSPIGKSWKAFACWQTYWRKVCFGNNPFPSPKLCPWSFSDTVPQVGCRR